MGYAQPNNPDVDQLVRDLRALAGSQCLLNAPTLAEPKIETGGANSSQRSPLSKNPCLPIECQTDRLARIRALFSLRRPSAVAGWVRRAWTRVRAIVVDAVQRFALGSWSHVGQKGGERIAPFIGHEDSAGAVQRIVAVGWIVAASLRVTPGTVLWSEAFAFCGVAVRPPQHQLGGGKTPTAFRVPADQIAANYGASFSAVAQAQPRFSATRLHDDQMAESLPHERWWSLSAAAALRLALSQQRPVNYSCRPARTTTQPMLATVEGIGTLQHQPTTQLLILQVNNAGHTA